MRKAELLKLGLEEELAIKVETASQEELKGYIPKARFDDAIDERNTLRESVKERDVQLETLKNSANDIEGLKKQIADLQIVNTEKDKAHAAEIETLKINAAVDSALTGAKAKNAKAVKALLDLEKAELSDDGTVKGLEDQLKKLQGADDSKFLFDSEPKKPTLTGANPAESGVEEIDTTVDVSKMSYEELAAYMEANPEAKF